ncbi:MAG: lysozyme [Candidatus Caenarcaniphilales bacterium]|nr:lysozyme [Candidatus Caenarcaniphilales bacterium]
MKTSEKGIKLIKEFEGFRNKAYLCSAGVWTIGYGSTRYSPKRKVKQGDQISLEEAEELLANDLIKFETAVNKFVTVKINQNQFDALVCFIYNIGEGAFKSSTLLKKLKLKDFTGTADEFLRWNKAPSPSTGKLRALPGLTRRRTAERKLFLSKAGASSSAKTETKINNKSKKASFDEKFSLDELKKGLIRRENNSINNKVKNLILKQAQIKFGSKSKELAEFTAYLDGLTDGLMLSKKV